MENKPINETHEEILRFIKNLKFKKKLFGGADEDDVLKKIEELNRLYETALLNERIRYNQLINQLKGGDKEDE